MVNLTKRFPVLPRHTGDANSETIYELTLKCFADPGYQRLRNGKHRASYLSNQGRKQRSEILFWLTFSRHPSSFAPFPDLFNSMYAVLSGCFNLTQLTQIR